METGNKGASGEPTRPDAEYWHRTGLSIIPLNSATLQPAVDRATWQTDDADVVAHFEANPDHVIGAILPENMFALETDGADVLLGQYIMRLDIRPVPTLRGYLFKAEDVAVIERIVRKLPEDVEILREGDIVVMRSNERFKSPGLQSLNDMDCWTAQHVARFAGTIIEEASENVPPLMEDNPFARFNVADALDVLRSSMLEATPLLGNLCLMGQATMIYAPPNTGKTLIAIKLLQDAVRSGRVHGSNVVYMNADDTASGLLEKAELFADLGVQMIAPGHKGMKTQRIMPMLQEEIDKDNVRGLVLLFDTVKKLASLMDKKESSAFTDICRQAVSKGATVIGLGHTNKNPNSQGKFVFAGTSDILDDFDAGYIINHVNMDEGTLRLVEFENKKRRGNNAETLMFLYDGNPELSYERRLASVVEIDAEQADEQRRLARLKSDERVIEAIATSIRDGDNGKMVLTKATAKATGLSERKVMDVLDRYSGEGPNCFWQYQKVAHGRMAYSLLQ